MMRTSGVFRRRVEQGCRTLAFLLLAIAASLVWGARRDADADRRVPPAVFAASGADSLDMLRALVIQSSVDPRTIAAPMIPKAVPSAPIRAALGSIQRAKIFSRGLLWRDGTGARGGALSVDPLEGPTAGVQVRTALPESTAFLLLRDAGGVLDSMAMPTASRVQVWQLQASSRSLAAQWSGATASQDLGGERPSLANRVRLFAAPGWESKFVMAALEERGWRVDARLSVTDRAAVTVGNPDALDPARYAVVIVLDSAGIPDGALQSFVRRGGGVVFGGDGVRTLAARALTGVRSTSRIAGIPGGLLTSRPRTGLERWDVDVPRAVRLEGESARGAVYALRVGQGRVIVSAYRESWRWRLLGTDDGLDAHRDWWAALAEAALPTATSPVAADPLPGDAAPYADWVAQIGAPVETVGASSAGPSSMPDGSTRTLVAWPWPLAWLPWLVGVAFLALLIEWASRRLRGEP